MENTGDMTKGQSSTAQGGVVGINCPACGHGMSADELEEIRVVLGAQKAEPRTMLEAMDEELDDPDRQEERKSRKE